MFEIVILLVAYGILIFLKPGGLTVFLMLIALGLIFLPGIGALKNGPPFVPTGRRRVRKMIEFANPKPGELAIDLGCGDGRLVRATAKTGATAIGYELSMPTFALAKVLTFGHPRASIELKDFWKQDYSHTDILYCYLLKDLMTPFLKNVWPTLKPGTRVVSHIFSIPGMTPDKEEDGVKLYVKK